MININNKNRIPKYKQIVSSIQNKIKKGDLEQGDKLPSINSLKNDLNIARDTVIKAYKELITMGIITSMPGKGYYVSKAIHDIEHHVFLLFDLFLPYKETVYNSLLDNIGEDAVVDIYFHHYNVDLYKKLIREAIGQYTDYVIMPLEAGPELKEWFDGQLGDLNTYILDLGIKSYGQDYPSVCQDFTKQWYDALSDAEDKIRNYESLVLVEYRSPLSEFSKPHDEDMIAGYKKFCKDKNINSKIIDQKKDLKMEANQCYIISDDNDLVEMIINAREKNYRLGEEIGIISHNETPLKNIVCMEGVSTITTDFEKMGENMADLINSGEQKHIVNPSKLIYRKSL